MRQLNLFKKLRGYVLFESQTGDYNKFLSEALEEKLPLWDTEIVDGYKLKAKVYPLDYKYIKEIANKYNLSLKVIKEKGIITRLRKISGIISIIFGLLISLFIISILSQFVWRIEVIGEEGYNASKIVEIAEENGIKIGALGKKLDLRYIEQVIMSKADDLAWIGISRKGVTVYIDVRERVVPEKLTYNDEPCNLVAFCDGLIVDATVYKGKQMVKENYTVSKGDILVSGAYSPSEDAKKMIYTHATGVFLAECPITKTFYLPLKTSQLERTNEVIERKFLKIFNFEMPLFIAKKLDTNYICETYEENINLFNIKLPFNILKRNYTKTENVNKNFTEIKDEVMDKMISNYETEISKNAEIISKTENRVLKNEIYTCEIKYILKMDIAKEEIIFIE